MGFFKRKSKSGFNRAWADRLKYEERPVRQAEEPSVPQAPILSVTPKSEQEDTGVQAENAPPASVPAKEIKPEQEAPVPPIKKSLVYVSPPKPVAVIRVQESANEPLAEPENSAEMLDQPLMDELLLDGPEKEIERDMLGFRSKMKQFPFWKPALMTAFGALVIMGVAIRFTGNKSSSKDHPVAFQKNKKDSVDPHQAAVEYLKQKTVTAFDSAYHRMDSMHHAARMRYKNWEKASQEVEVELSLQDFFDKNLKSSLDKYTNVSFSSNANAFMAKGFIGTRKQPDTLYSKPYQE